MDWNTVLNNWENGKYFTYPKSKKTRFFWNTSVLKNNGKSKFIQKFKSYKLLPEKQNITSFEKYINKSNNKYVVYFPNLSKDTLLVVPIPREGKNYATIKDFIDNAPIIQQKMFWKEVATLARKQLKIFKKVWISTHGMGVPYLHVRICKHPKYYFDAELSQN